MKSLFISTLFFLITLLPAFSQQDQILMTIGDRNVTLQEFERVYHKNNLSSMAEKQTVDEYLELFINFKLKVIEAENLGMDTLSSFKKELSGYRDQLAKPYLNDTSVLEELMKIQYERMKWDLRVSHILLKLDPKASLSDTLVVYNKLLEIRKRLLKGEDFEKVARETSEDQSVKTNGGDVGWLTAFRTIWDFENVIYNTPEGQISIPIRTQYGYHLAKVVKKRPAKGTISVAHIFVRSPQDMSPEQKAAAEKKVFAVYDSIMQGVDFATLALNNSDDGSTSEKGGVLPPFGPGQMIPPFEEVAFEMQTPGEISKPVRTFYGWHIIKFLELKKPGTYEQSREYLKNKLNEAPIAYVKKRYFLNHLKKQHNYTFNAENFRKFQAYVDTSIFSGRWNDSHLLSDQTVLFTVGPKSFTYADFAAYLKQNQRKQEKIGMDTYLTQKFDLYSESALQAYEKDMLETRYPEFRYILQEYHDGILLFDLTDKLVWTKALEDTTGLEQYYEANKNSYMWEKRADVLIFSSDSLELLNAARSVAVKYGKKKTFTPDLVLEKVCTGDSLKNCINIKEAQFEKGDNEEVDKTGWKTGAGESFSAEGVHSFIYVRKILDPMVKRLDEARGLVTADYQNHLEKLWIADLRSRYPVKVNRELLKTVK